MGNQAGKEKDVNDPKNLRGFRNAFPEAWSKVRTTKSSGKARRNITTASGNEEQQ